MSSSDASHSSSTSGNVVVIVGLPGVGKSTIGRRVARQLGWEFVDLDTAIEVDVGVSVREIFSQKGEEAFREIESRILEQSLDSASPRILATGGGVVLGERNRIRLASARTVIWMFAGDRDLERRLRPASETGRNHRPLLDGELSENLRRLRGEREHLYEQVSTNRIDTSDKSFDQVVAEVLAIVSERHLSTHSSADLEGRPKQ